MSLSASHGVEDWTGSAQVTLSAVIVYRAMDTTSNRLPLGTLACDTWRIIEKDTFHTSLKVASHYIPVPRKKKTLKG
jgi:hypothetical protein